MSTIDSLLIKQIIASAAAKKATDIHLTVGNQPFFRVNGKLTASAELSIIKPETLEEIVEFFLTPEQKKTLLANREITMDYYSEQTSLRFKVNIFFQKGYPMVSLRSIPPVIPEFSALGLPKVVADFSDNKHGLIIISGPFSSGRSTTLAALIQLINLQRSEHIITLEKPIEYLFVNEKSLIDQREVGKDVISYEQGMETILDEDVNIIAVAEADSAEVFEHALALAESGRLVILVMSSDSVISVLEKIIAGFAKEKKLWALNVLSDVLVGILIQRLLPKATGDGMVLAYEILTMTPAVKSLIIEGKFFQLTSVLQTSRNEGMINLDKSLIDLAKKGIITRSEAIANAQDEVTVNNVLKN